MKVLANVASAAIVNAQRHRKYGWCRLRNDFVDKPMWRVVAERLNMPLYQVQAFVTRLESFANAATPRGDVSQFSALEFAAALGMQVDDAARLYAALESDDVGWIVQDHVHDFWERNPDKEDKTANERQRRRTARLKATKDIARRAEAGLLTPVQRAAEEAEVWGSTYQIVGHHPDHGVMRRDSVMITPREDHSVEHRPVKSLGQKRIHSLEITSPDEVQNPEEWLTRTGTQIVAARGRAIPSRAELVIARWLRDLADVPGGAGALKAAIVGANGEEVIGGRFFDVVSREVRDCIIQSKRRLGV